MSVPPPADTPPTAPDLSVKIRKRSSFWVVGPMGLAAACTGAVMLAIAVRVSKTRTYGEGWDIMVLTLLILWMAYALEGVGVVLSIAGLFTRRGRWWSLGALAVVGGIIYAVSNLDHPV